MTNCDFEYTVLCSVQFMFIQFNFVVYYSTIYYSQ